MIGLDVFTEFFLGGSCHKRVVLLLVIGLGLALHAEENHLLRAHFFDGLTSEDTADEALRDLSGMLFVLLLCRCQHLAIVHALLDVVRFHRARNLLQRVEVTSATLTTSLVLLDQADGLNHFDIEGEGVVGDFFDGLRGGPTIEQGFINLGILLVHGEHFLRFFAIIILLLSLLLLLRFAALLSLLLLAVTALDLFLEDDVDRDLIVLPEVAGHRDFDDRRVILEIEQEAIKMDVDGAATEIVEDQVFFELANTADGALQHLLDEDALLRVHDLIVTLLKFAVDLDVFDIKYGVVREAFFETPKLTILHSMLVLVGRSVLDLDLLLQVIHSIAKL